MNNTTCYNCGSAYIPRGTHRVCPSCGFVRPEGLSNEEHLLLEQAYQRLTFGDFIGAQRIFGDMIRQYPRNAQAYFGRLLAKYRVKYEEDSDGFRFPFCCSSLAEGVTESSYYQKASEYADPLTLAVFERHASHIEHCRLDRIAEAEARKADVSASAAQTINGMRASQGLAYKAIDAKTCMITGQGTCKDKQIVIPEEIEGRRVTEVVGIRRDRRYFSVFQKNITSVLIPDSVTRIGENAFRDCTSLASVVIPDSVTSIGGYAFYGCTSLASAEVLVIDTSRAKQTIAQCPCSVRVKIKNSVTSIGEDAFKDCKKLVSVEIPDSVTSIERGAFYGCTGIVKLTVGYPETDLKNTDNECTKNIIIEEIPSIRIGNEAFSGCTSLKSVEIYDSVTSIGGSAFSDCKSLASVTIPDSVTTIGGYVFHECTSLETIRYHGTKKQWKKISFSKDWKKDSAIRSVECTDGTVKP